MLKKRLFFISSLFLTAVLASACASVPISPPGTPSTLNPQGPGAAHLAQLWWVMFAFGAAVYVLVILLMAAAVLRHKRGSSATLPDIKGGDTGRRWLTLGGLVLPLVILAIVFGYTIFTLAKIENTGTPGVHINIIGRRWWWEVHYPDQGVTTANEIHIPVGVPVQVNLESADVIHSFWIPELHGKIDLVPTRSNNIVIQADHAGVYRGECAEFCGLQHAHMGFMVVAESQDDYTKWVSAQKAPASDPPDKTALKGQDVFLNSGCVFCHTIRGMEDKQTDRSAIDLGPDLTHLASRLTIAGASLTANKGNLSGWIVDPQHVKPGGLMPNMELNSQDLHNLLAFLETLH